MNSVRIHSPMSAGVALTVLAVTVLQVTPEPLQAAITSWQEPCARYDPVLVPTPGTEHDQHDQSLAPDLAQRVVRFVRGREENRRGSVDTHNIPTHPGHLLVREGSLPGQRFLHVVHGDGQLEIAWTGPGMGDSWMLDPVFFHCDDRVVILASTGDIISWGLEAYVFSNGTVDPLGTIDAAVDPGDWPPAPGPQDALSHATVRMSDGNLTVEFDVDMILRPGRRDEEPVARSGGPVRFVYEAGEFVLVSESNG